MNKVRWIRCESLLEIFDNIFFRYSINFTVMFYYLRFDFFFETFLVRATWVVRLGMWNCVRFKEPWMRFEKCMLPMTVTGVIVLAYFSIFYRIYRKVILCIEFKVCTCNRLSNGRSTRSTMRPSFLMTTYIILYTGIYRHNYI